MKNESWSVILPYLILHLKCYCVCTGTSTAASSGHQSQWKDLCSPGFWCRNCKHGSRGRQRFNVFLGQAAGRRQSVGRFWYRDRFVGNLSHLFLWCSAVFAIGESPYAAEVYLKASSHLNDFLFNCGATKKSYSRAIPVRISLFFPQQPQSSPVVFHLDVDRLNIR